MKHIILYLVFFFSLSVEGLSNDYLSQENNISSQQFTNSPYATNFQALSQVLESSKIANIILDAVFEQNALEYVYTYEHNNTESLSRKIIVTTLYGANNSALIQSLLNSQNSDGGFGELPEFASSVVDTAFALKALINAGVNGGQIANAVSFLSNQQNADGSWNDGINISDTYLSAITMHSLWLVRDQYNVTSSLEAVKIYLQSKQSVAGLWDEHFQSAVSLIAIAPIFSDNSLLLASVDALNQAQLINQSWDNDPYTTALVLQAIVIASKPVPNPDLSNLKGVVLDGDTDTPLSNINITLDNAQNLSTATDVNGHFNFNGLEDGIYELHILSNNYAPLHSSIHIVGEEIDLGNIRLTKNLDATTSIIKGTIKDDTTNLPILGVHITLGTQATITDSEGNYFFSNIEAGEYTISAKKDDYYTIEEHLSISGNTLTYYNILLKKTDLNVNATIQGIVIDKATLAELEGVDITLINNLTISMTTLANGVFSFQNIEQGNYRLEIKKIGYNSVYADIIIDYSQIIDLGRVALAVVDSTVETVSVKGTVTDIISNMPIESALVKVGTLSIYSDVNGNYEITQVPSGIISLEVSKIGYDTVLAQAEAEAGSSIIFSPKLQRNDVPLSIFGTIFDANSSEQLSDVKVEYTGEDNRTVYTDQNGFYYISPVSSGSAQIKFTKFDYEVVNFNVEVETQNLNISPILNLLQKDNPGNNASIQGVILDSTTNQPLSGVNIHLNGIFTDEIFSSDINGSFKFTNILSYDMNLTFELEGYNTVDTMVILGKDEGFDIRQVRMRPLSADVLFSDLVMRSINISTMHIEQDKLELSGSIGIKVTNQGKITTEQGFSLLAFYDTNHDGNYTESIDNVLGENYTNTILGVEDNVTIIIDLTGELPYVNAPISLWIDFKTEIIESNEENNMVYSSDRCTVIPLTTIGQFNPKVKFEWDWKNASYSSYNQVMSAPMVGQLNDDNDDGKINNDDIPDIIFTTFKDSYNYDGILRAISGKDGEEILAIPNVSPTYALAIGDIDSDGLLEIIIGINVYGGLKVFENDGTLKWSISTNKSGAPALADLDNDGEVEIIYGGGIYNSLGNKLWSYNPSSIPIIANIDNNNELEVISDGKAYSANGNLLWDSGYSGYSFGAIGNFDDDKYPEIVMKKGNKRSSSYIILLEHNGDIKWGPILIPGRGGGAITVSDVDADGEAEIGIAGARYYVVYETDGSVKWKSETRDYSSAVTGSTVFDFEGDGKSEILYNDELYFRIYDGETGEVLFDMNNTSGTLYEYPVVADIDNDGHAEIILATNNYVLQEPDRLGGVTGIRVLEDANDSWMPTRSIWNQHSYHINNINDDGTIPRVEEPSWLTHNSYRLNTFIDKDPRSVPDLSVSLLKLIEHEDANLSLFVRVGSGGSDKLRSSTKVVFYDGNPENGGILIGKQEITSLNKGKYIDITLDNIAIPISDNIYVAVDPHNQINECDETNNRMNIPAIAHNTLGEISVFTDATIYRVNQLAHFKSTSINLGKLDANFTSQLVLKDENNNVVQHFNSVDLGTISAGMSSDTTQNWYTGTILSGTYHLYATLYDVDNEITDQSSVSFNIISDSNTTSLASLSLESDKRVYSTNDTVFINSLIGNLSLNNILRNATLELEIKYSENNEILFTHNISISEMAPKTLIKIPSTNALVDVQDGNYTVFGKIVTEDNTILVTDSITFEVKTKLSEILKADIKVTYPVLEQGDTQVCTYTIFNVGNIVFSEQPLRLILANINTDENIMQIDETFSLDVDSKISYEKELNTISLQTGEYAYILQSSVNGKWITLGYAGFTLKEPPIRMEYIMDIGTRGRLLILLDDSATEPFCPKNIVTPQEQRVYLENLLKDNGYAYTIVTDAKSFEREFRSGKYNSYAILSEVPKLSKALQKEMGEAVFRGEGLLVGGKHDQRNGRIDQIAGVIYKGKNHDDDDEEDEHHKHDDDKDHKKNKKKNHHDDDEEDEHHKHDDDKDHKKKKKKNHHDDDDEDDDENHHDDDDEKDDDCKEENHHYQSIDINSTNYLLEYDDDKLRISTLNNEIIATFKDSGDAAITYKQHYKGSSIFIAFDLLLYATDKQGKYETLLLDMFKRIQSETYPSYNLSLLPIKLQLNNLGIPIDGENITLHYNTNALIIDSSDGTLNEDNSLQWNYNLLDTNTTKLNFWILPYESGILEFENTIYVKRNGLLILHDSFVKSFDINENIKLNDLLTLIQNENDGMYKHTIKYLKKADKASLKNKIAKAIKYSLKAANALKKLNTKRADELRYQLAYAIKILSMQYYTIKEGD